MAAPATTELRLIFTAVEPPLGDAWQRFCGDVPFVTSHRGSVLDIASDAVVSPANSYGFMDGGIDALYVAHFGPTSRPACAARSLTVMQAMALPGLGTGVGRIGFNTCAHQVRAAIDDVLLAGYQMPRSWAEASERHPLLYTDRPTRL